MSQETWNDLSPASAMRPIVERGPQTLSVFPWTRTMGGLSPHVVLRVGEETDSQMMQLTPSEARGIAVALLQAAEKVDTET
jgi:hypothetical protein